MSDIRAGSTVPIRVELANTQHDIVNDQFEASVDDVTYVPATVIPASSDFPGGLEFTATLVAGNNPCYSRVVGGTVSFFHGYVYADPR